MELLIASINKCFIVVFLNNEKVWILQYQSWILFLEFKYLSLSKCNF